MTALIVLGMDAVRPAAARGSGAKPLIVGGFAAARGRTRLARARAT